MVSTNKLVSKLIAFFILLLFGFSFLPLAAIAASKTAKVYFLPTTGSLEVGEIFDVRAAFKLPII
ncbi:hypothetical protein IID20_05220 [Patescibacteria group bacterium]|nr:hypothetical protein [Patescibacteria group bacterium]